MVENLAKKIEQWLLTQKEQRGARGFVVGLSGGIDSAVTATMCKNVCPDNTLGVIMPCYSNKQDAEHAELLAKTIGIEYKTVVLDNVFSQMVKLLTGSEYDPEKKDMTIANIKPRLRMTTLYYYAAETQSLVVGTGNRCELTVGYFTKHGDGGVDILPIANLVKGEVKELAKYLGVPEPIISKPPSAGLWMGQNDEKEMGITYEELDEYILNGRADERVKKTVDELARKSMHKRQLPATPPL
ncbi:NAD+ synthase [Desulfotomaculum arcticum]|uniref:NH(3)-dependent NAD(+) synthetase n=1 Tax=Desulfotruncus arcticus DSM 17038 TaxID=1121424 RepID=A0A1I2SFG4_9FIRM|nr:NAD(+) synthase [Desulfotruncus arcticus]SFG51460.1 NAD+ synthase [Desulfotomaculum arcticum] [Desulfotruncus arcticus DSM 17038]